MKYTTAKRSFFLFLEIELGRTPQTLDGYAKDLRYFLDFLLQRHFQEEPTINEINILHLRDYLHFLKNEKEYAPRSIARNVATIKSFFKFCQDEELVSKNPANKIHSPKVPVKPPFFLTQEEMERLFNAVLKCKSNMYRDLAILKVLYYTGIRVSELVALRVEDIDVHNHILTVQKGKGQKYREVPLNLKARESIIDYLTHERLSIGSPYLFISTHNSAFSTQYIRKIIKKHSQAAGLDSEKVTPHVLRHSFATALYKDHGVDLNRISKLLGHSSINTTTIYTHTSTKHLMDAVDLL